LVHPVAVRRDYAPLASTLPNCLDLGCEHQPRSQRRKPNQQSSGLTTAQADRQLPSPTFQLDSSIWEKLEIVKIEAGENHCDVHWNFTRP
jgi:hypothetical protein